MLISVRTYTFCNIRLYILYIIFIYILWDNKVHQGRGVRAAAICVVKEDLKGTVPMYIVETELCICFMYIWMYPCMYISEMT